MIFSIGLGLAASLCLVAFSNFTARSLLREAEQRFRDVEGVDLQSEGRSDYASPGETEAFCALVTAAAVSDENIWEITRCYND